MTDKLSAYHTIYLTGAQATGKSSLATYLTKTVQPLKIFSYSEMLANWMSQKNLSNTTRAELRKQSSKIVTLEDIQVVDNLLLDAVHKAKIHNHVIIDSHAVTKEDYGFRITPFSLSKLQAFSPTMICVLYADPQIIIDRTKIGGDGRKQLSYFDATTFLELQSSVAVTYGILVDAPVYFLDTSKSVAEVASEIIVRMQKKNSNTVLTGLLE